MNKWQGNPELVKHRKRLVSNSFALGSIANGRAEVSVNPDKTNWYRSSGSMVCAACDLTYWQHPGFPYETDGSTFDIELCNGDVVHL